MGSIFGLIKSFTVEQRFKTMYNRHMSDQLPHHDAHNDDHNESSLNAPLRKHKALTSMPSDSAIDSVVGMTVEKARVISIEPASNGDNGALWVEVFQKSTCGSCEVKGACGQGVLSRWLSRGSHSIRVLCDKGQADFFTVGQWVDIGVPDGVVLKASLMAYLLPLLSMIVVAAVFDSLFQYGGDLFALIGGIIGFVAGLALVRSYEHKHLDSRQNQPQLLVLSYKD